MKLFIISVLFISSSTLFSQDLIRLVNGKEINVEIVSENNDTLMVVQKIKNERVPFYYPKSLVKEFKYNFYHYKSPEERAQEEHEEEEVVLKVIKTDAITIGFLKGGGALIGTDFEFAIVNNFAFQLGIGYKGFGGGINIHTSADLNSSYISFQYMNQGFGQNTVSRIISLNYCLRSNHIDLQIGLGKPIYSKSKNLSFIILTYAAGYTF